MPKPLYVLPASYTPNWVWTLKERAEVKRRSKSPCVVCGAYVSFWDSHWPLCEAESRIKDLEFFRRFYPKFDISTYHFDSKLRNLIRANRLQTEVFNRELFRRNTSEREIRLKQLRERRLENLKRTQSIAQRHHYYRRVLNLGGPPSTNLVRQVQNELFNIQVAEHLTVLNIERIPTLHTTTNFR